MRPEFIEKLVSRRGTVRQEVKFSVCTCPRESEHSKILRDCAHIFAKLRRRIKYERNQQDKTEKKLKKRVLSFLGNFLDPKNGHPSNDPRAFVLAEVGAVIRKKREGETKREIETQRELVVAQKGTQIMGRACPCLSLHLVSPWRNFTLRKLRK